MWCKKRHNIVLAVLRPFFAAYYRIFFGCKIKRETLPDTGAVIISNHVTTLDPILIALQFNKLPYFMTSKHIFQNRRIGRLLKFLVNPIPKEKINRTDIAAIKSCMQVARENGSICIFPEGNRTFSGKLSHVDPAIVKLTKRLGKPLIVCNILGGYGADPRWSNANRAGKMQVFVKKTYSVEQMAAMTNEELYDAIVSNMTVDEFAGKERYRNSRRAECLESVAFICPICGAKHTIYTKKHKVYCSSCGMELTYNEDQTLSCENGDFPFRYVHQWYDYQLKVLQETDYADGEQIYEDKVTVYEPELGKKKKLLGSGVMQLYGNRLCLGLDSGEICLPAEEIDGITLIGNRIMDVYSGEKTFRIRVEHKTNLLKYLHTFYILRSRNLETAREFVGI